MHTKHFIYTFLALCTSIASWAQFEFYAQVSSQSIGINQRIEVRFTMTERAESFKRPSFEHFDIIGGPNQSESNITLKNGEKSMEKSFSFYIQPKKKGTLKIEPASVEYEGEVYKTQPIIIQVSDEIIVKQKSNNSPRYLKNIFEEIERKASKKYFKEELVYKENPDNQFHITLKTRADSIFVNEVFAIEYGLLMKIDSTNTFSSVNANISKIPEYKDSLVLDVIPEQDIVFHNTNNVLIKVNDVLIEKEKKNIYCYAPLVTYFLKSGKKETIEIKPLEIELITKDTVTNMVHNEILVSENKTIKAVLLKNQPKKFSGIFGNFDIKTRTNQYLVKIIETLEIIVTITGAGFLPEGTNDILKPEIESNLKYSLALKEDNTKNVFLNDVQKTTITYTFVPKEKGIYKIRPVDFSYFNIRTNEYTTVSTEEIIIEAD